jgi:hypothetical protein
MASSIYQDKHAEPDLDQFSADLLLKYQLFEMIREYLDHHYGQTFLAWKYYGKNIGWIMKLLVGKKNVMFIIPRGDHFSAAFTFGEKTTKKILESNTRFSIRSQLDHAAKYAEGRTIQIEVNHQKDIDDISRLIDFKLAQ